MDKFTLETAWMGELHAARIGHDGKRPNPAWYLETTFVTDELNGGEWEFECRAWLDTKLSQDGKRVKTLVRDLIGNEMESKILSNLSCAAPCQQPGRRSNFSNSSDAYVPHHSCDVLVASSLVCVLVVTMMNLQHRRAVKANDACMA